MLMQLHFVISSWANNLAEELVLAGVATQMLLEHPTLRREELVGDSLAELDEIPLLSSSKLDGDGLTRFWASVGQTPKPALQCWLSVPIYPHDEGRPLHRVQEREFRFGGVRS
jgi:hypothetical protein